MLTYQKKPFVNVGVRLDGGVFEECSFQGCTLNYGGGSVPVFSDCSFEGCRWQFEDAAGRTVAFIRAIAETMGPEGRALIEDLFPSVSPLDRAREVLDGGRNRFYTAMKERGVKVPTAGFRESAVIIDGEVPLHAATESFLGKLFAVQPQHTGWPAWIDSRGFPDQVDQPTIHNGTWEAVLADTGDGLFHDPHLDFWRMDPQGVFYLLRALEDDLPYPNPKPDPGTQLDYVLQITRVAEIISVALSFGKSIGSDPLKSSLAFAFRWSKLKGRYLTSWCQPQRTFQPGSSAREDELVTAVTVPLDTSPSSVAPHVESAVRNLFALFGGTKIESRVIAEIVEERLKTHF